jgi:putative ABC transport system permease protein
VQPGEWLSMYPEFVVSDEARKAWNQTRTGAIVGRKTAERFGWKVGDRVPIQSMIWPKRDGNMTWEFDLVGIYDGKERGTDTTQFFFRYDYFDEARQFLEGQVGWYLVRVKDPSESATVARRVDDLFTNSAAETKTDTEKAFVASFAKQVGDIGTIVTAIGGVVLFTILLVAGNTMAQAVRERTEELGVLKALGFTNGQVLALVIAEACLLAGLGGLGGLGLAWLMISRGDPTGGFFPVFYFPVQDVWWGIGLAALLGVLSGILPAVQALRLRIADALRRM